MARKRLNPPKKESSGLKLKVKKHIDALGLGSVDEYQKWCIDHGFQHTTEKKVNQLEQEMSAFRRAEKTQNERSTIHRNPKKLIEKACGNAIKKEEVNRSGWSELVESILNSNSDPESRNSLKELLLKVFHEADFLTDSTTFGDQTYPYIHALIKINSRNGQWIHPLEDWKISSHNRSRQFSSLVRHLFAEYSVPYFMDSVWFRNENGSYKYRDWFIHIGLGANIRKANTPIPLTKKMSHYFLDAPNDYTVENAIRWGQIHALGGDKRLTEALLATRLNRTFENNDFWGSVIRFFINNPLLERKYVGPIVDYLQSQKFTIEEVVTGPGQVERRLPPKPNLSMGRRNPEALLKEVEKWHSDLGRSISAKNLYFRRSGIKEYLQLPKPKKKQVWKIIELLSGADLTKEGNAMHHCIASYASSCVKGQCSIWSMQLHTEKGMERRQTIEVDSHGVIRESRGKYNRWPTPGEYDVLKRWALSQELTISKYISIQS